MSIRSLLSFFAVAVVLNIAFMPPASAQAAASNPATQPNTIESPELPPGSVEQWGIFEVPLKGPSGGNPFIDVQLGATFATQGKSITVSGFYDGDGTYRIRFMPTDQGEWKYQTTSNRPELAGKTGTFTCVKPGKDDHGPVHVARTFHFDYADGSPYFEIGTTCYNWHEELDPMEEQTLASLKASPFNKVRMIVLPGFPTKRQLYPYQTIGPVTAGTMPTWDYSRLNPEFFQHMEKRIGDLRDLNIQADVIFYSPYGLTRGVGPGFNGVDRQGKGVDAAGDERYLKYMVARLGAYRNVWWSMANEYDLMGKTYPLKQDDSYWDKLCQIVSNTDPYHHLLSIHFSAHIYSGNFKPWITHISIQNGSATADFGRAVLYRDVYYKPIVFDEMNYEGHGAARWGQLTGEEMTAQFWHAWIDGTYAGHGEVVSSWSGSGGVLKGESPPRIAFLKKVMEDGPATGINPVDKWRDLYTAGKGGEYYIVYFGDEEPKEWYFELPNKEGLRAGMTFKVDILDTWNMTITPVQGTFTTQAAATRYTFVAQNNAKITLPGKPYIALRITVVR